MYKILGADGNEYGPVTADTIRQWIAEGRANAQTQLLQEGAGGWRPLPECPEFAAALAEAARRSTIPGPIAPPVRASQTNSLAVASLVFGLLSVTLGLCCYGFPFNLAGLICGITALGQMSRNPGQEQGKGIAIAGLVLSLLSLMLVLAGVVFSCAAPGMMHRIRRL
jgi:hypothetical protein